MKITGTILTFTYNFPPIYCSCTKMTITLQNIVMAKESLAFAVLPKLWYYISLPTTPLVPPFAIGGLFHPLPMIWTSLDQCKL